MQQVLLIWQSNVAIPRIIVKANRIDLRKIVIVKKTKKHSISAKYAIILKDESYLLWTKNESKGLYSRIMIYIIKKR